MAHRRLLVLALAGVAVLAVGCATGESFVRQGYDFSGIDKVAVVEVAGDVAGEATKNQVADFFSIELMKKGYTPVERRQVQAILKEQKFQRSDLTSAEGAAAAGRILNVPAVMIVNIVVHGERISRTAKMVDVEDASILWIGSGYGSTARTLATVGGAVAGAAGGAVLGSAGGGRGATIAGAIGGGLLGGVAGDTLSPQVAHQVQRVARKVCVKLPARR